jgi:hypothetical protein
MPDAGGGGRPSAVLASELMVLPKQRWFDGIRGFPVISSMPIEIERGNLGKE